MSVKRQIVLIPHWIADVLRRKQLPLATVVDFPQLRKVVPAEDLAALVALQEQWNILCGLQEPCAGSIVCQWFKTVGHAGTEDNTALSSTVLPLAADPSVGRDLQTRLFAGSGRLEQQEEPFVVVDLSAEFAGVVVNPGFFGSGDFVALAKQFLTAVLKALYVYEPQNEVAKTPLFRRYLALL